MLSFFIFDKNVINEAYAKRILEKNRIDEIIIRNRKLKNDSIQSFFPHKKPFVQPDFKNIIITRVRGVHCSLFHDKITSKTSLRSFNNLKVSASGHNLKEIIATIRRFKPDFIFISPVFKTKTHIDAKSLGVTGLFKLINQTRYTNFIILGGISSKIALKIKKLDYKSKIKGFASIRNFQI